MKHQHPRLVICGTDTDVGKTIVSSLLVQGLKGIYWKPVQSGLEKGGDTGRVQSLLSLSPDRYLPEAYKFKNPVSPHWAAEQENKLIDCNQLSIPLHKGPLIIETAGGLMVPLTRDFLQIDQIKAWNIPVVLVARSGLGTLNHTLLSLESMRNRNIPILGLFLNGPNHQDNPKTLEKLGNISLIGQLPPLKEITAKVLSEEWKKQKLQIQLEKLLTKFQDT